MSPAVDRRLESTRRLALVRRRRDRRRDGRSASATADVGDRAASFPAPTPKADCGPGAPAETDIQGRVPAADYKSGRVRARLPVQHPAGVHQGNTGGFKVLRYSDAQGQHLRVLRLDAAVPARRALQRGRGPRRGRARHERPGASRGRPTTLTSPGDADSPHESLLLNKKRGLLAAVLGNAAHQPRRPRHLRRADRLPAPEAAVHARRRRCSATRAASRPTARRSTVQRRRPDASPRSTSPTRPQPTPIFQQLGVNYHGLRLSDDGRTMYVANIGNPTSGASPPAGCGSSTSAEIQDRKSRTPRSTVLVDLTWPERSIPQVGRAVHPQRPPLPPRGRRVRRPVNSVAGATQADARRRRPDHRRRRPAAPEGGLRTSGSQVHQPDARNGDQQQRPRARGSRSQGYAAPLLLGADAQEPEDRRLLDDPVRAAALRHPRRAQPREVAYFNKPMRAGHEADDPRGAGAYAMSQPAWDVAHRSVWYTDAQLRVLRRQADQRPGQAAERDRWLRRARSARLETTGADRQVEPGVERRDRGLRRRGMPARVRGVVNIPGVETVAGVDTSGRGARLHLNEDRHGGHGVHATVSDVRRAFLARRMNPEPLMPVQTEPLPCCFQSAATETIAPESSRSPDTMRFHGFRTSRDPVSRPPASVSSDPGSSGACRLSRVRISSSDSVQLGQRTCRFSTSRDAESQMITRVRPVPSLRHGLHTASRDVEAFADQLPLEHLVGGGPGESGRDRGRGAATASGRGPAGQQGTSRSSRGRGRRRRGAPARPSPGRRLAGRGRRTPRPGDVRVPEQDPLDGCGGEVLAVDAEPVAGAAGEVDEAVGVAVGEVAGPVHAVAASARRSRRRSL